MARVYHGYRQNDGYSLYAYYQRLARHTITLSCCRRVHAIVTSAILQTVTGRRHQCACFCLFVNALVTAFCRHAGRRYAGRRVGCRLSYTLLPRNAYSRHDISRHRHNVVTCRCHIMLLSLIALSSSTLVIIAICSLERSRHLTFDVGEHHWLV